MQSAKDTFQTEQEPQLLAGISQAEEAVSALQYQISQTTDEETLAVLNAQLEQAQQKLDELNATYDSAKAQLEESESRLSESKALFEQKKVRDRLSLTTHIHRFQAEGHSLMPQKQNLHNSRQTVRLSLIRQKAS